MVTETSYTFISIRLDEREFHNVFDKYYVALCLFANQYTENEEVSADIVQDSFAKLWQIREDFFYLHQVKSFLYTAVRNKALNELEHSKVVFEYAQKVIEKRKDSFFHDAVVEEETCRMLICKRPVKNKHRFRFLSTTGPSYLRTISIPSPCHLRTKSVLSPFV